MDAPPAQQNKKISHRSTLWEIYIYNTRFLLLVQSEVNVYCASNRATYHWVVTNTEEAHHLYVSRN